MNFRSFLRHADKATNFYRLCALDTEIMIIRTAQKVKIMSKTIRYRGTLRNFSHLHNLSPLSTRQKPNAAFRAETYASADTKSTLF